MKNVYANTYKLYVTYINGLKQPQQIKICLFSTVKTATCQYWK